MSEDTQTPQFSESTPAEQPFGGTIQQQVVLSWGKTVEISFNAVRARFWRSLITASGVILAITFLMATFTRGAAIKGMNEGIFRNIESEREAMAGEAELVGLANKAAAGNAALKDLPDRVGSSDYKAAMELLNTALSSGQAVEGGSELKAQLLKTQASTKRIQDLDRLRRQMIEKGHAVGLEQDEQRESEARDLWLISLALLVALVGIINAMLMSVTERFREIGTMKCLGALDQFIVKLFLIESSFQGLFGTLLGVVLGLGLSLLKLWWEYGSSFWGFLPGEEVGIRILYAMGIGTLLAVVGALYPAIVAARMEPVVAMRVDQ